MKRLRKVVLVLLACMLALGVVGLAACNKNKNKTYPTQIVNGGFEQNPDESTWKGWTKGGTAFSALGVVEAPSAEANIYVSVEKTGDKFFCGLDGGTRKMTGTLTSDPFKLTGTGKIAFKMGAAQNKDKIYVEFFEVGNDKTALAKVSNTDFDGVYITDQMIRKIVDLSAHLNKNIYIKVTDNDNGDDWSYVNLDDFVVCLTTEDVAKYEAERVAQLNRLAEPAFEEDETETTVRNGSFETGDLTNWKRLEGTAFIRSVSPMSEYYWTDRSVYGHGDYYLNGFANPETATGAIRSTKFTLSGDGYISFMIGGGRQNGCYVAICAGEDFTVGDGPDAEEKSEGDELIKITNEGFDDPKLALTLLRVYVDASAYMDKVLYIKIVDKSVTGEGGFCTLNADDFRCSLTQAQVETLEEDQYKAIVAETYSSATYDDLGNLKEYYLNYQYPFALRVPLFTQYAANVARASTIDAVDLSTYIENVAAVYGADEETVTDFRITKVVCGDATYTEGFDAFDLSKDGTYYVTYTAKHNGIENDARFTLLVHSDSYQVANGGFETGDLTGWTVLTDGWGYTLGQPNGVISATQYWGEELPYNQVGNYHLDGWNTGIDEGATWTVRSTVFTLGGSGWISVKMGGRAAAFKVYKADGTQLGEYRQTRMNDIKFENGFLTQGGSWADMATYVVDLHAFLGEQLYIELCDIAVEPDWKFAFFDDVVTYYETAPVWETLYDTVQDGHSAAYANGEVTIAWVKPDNELDQVVFDNPVPHTVLALPTTAYDFTAYLADVTAKFGYENTLVPAANITIVKIEKAGETTITSGFNAVTLSVGDYKVYYAGTYAGKATTLYFIVSVYDASALTNNVTNGGFEEGDLTGWTVLTDGWGTDEDGNPNGVVNETQYWGEELPTNQVGNFHLSGEKTGIAEGGTWTIRSTVFTLGGSGWITVKMGGRAAAVKVYKADGTQLGEYRQQRTIDDPPSAFPHIKDGGSWRDMATYAIDLSDYIGENLYIELCDIAVDGSWANAYFDDVVTYYATAPDYENLSDTVTDGHRNGETPQEVQIPWVLAVNVYSSDN